MASADEFNTIAMDIVNQALDYARGGTYNESIDHAIRGMRVTTNVLMSALQQAQTVQRPAGTPT